jgi:hypothetical protein
MEAARPAPDRWRAIASWLGVSVTAVLLAAELLSEQEADDADHTAPGAGLSALSWDERSSASEGDYFSQERSMIADQVRSGTVSSLGGADAARRARPRAAGRRHRRRPRLVPGPVPQAVRVRRACPRAVAGRARHDGVGIPAEAFDNALLLVSELVTNSDSEWIELEIIVDRDLLRVEVSDQSTRSIRPRTPDLHGGCGLAIVGELATRWGVARQADGKTIWIEIDVLP